MASLQGDLEAGEAKAREFAEAEEDALEIEEALGDEEAAES